MNLFSGIIYNYRGLKLGVKTPRLLALGLARFLLIVAITVVLAGLVLSYYHEILSLIWNRPESSWILWLWHLISWFVALLLIRVSGIPMLEKRADEKWGGQADYEAYKERTPVLVPRLW